MATKESKSTRGTKIIVFLEVLSTQVPCYSFKSFRVMQQFVSWGSILSSLEELALKLVMLFAILSGQRTQSLHLLDIRHVTVYPRHISVQIEVI